MWAPVHDEEWDGDVPLNLERAKQTDADSEEGTIVFDAGKLPWRIGRYEVCSILTHRRRGDFLTDVLFS